jgi:toxin ParE1/3/4
MPAAPDRLVWAARAERDIREIWTYYANEASPEVADRMIQTIRSTAARLIGLPYAGRPRDELRPGLRSILANPYVIFYRVQDDSVEVARVLHQHRNIGAAVFESD